MTPAPRCKSMSAERPRSDGWSRRIAVAVFGGSLLLGSANVLAQASGSQKPPPAQKQPAKPGAQAGEQKIDGNSPGYAPRRPGQPGAPEDATRAPARNAAGGAEKTPAKPGAQSGKEPAAK